MRRASWSRSFILMFTVGQSNVVAPGYVATKTTAHLGQARGAESLDSIPLHPHATVEKAATAVALPHLGRLHHRGSAADRRWSRKGH